MSQIQNPQLPQSPQKRFQHNPAPVPALKPEAAKPKVVEPKVRKARASKD